MLKTSLTADELIVHFTYGVKLVQYKIETSLSTDEFEKMQRSLKMQDEFESQCYESYN